MFIHPISNTLNAAILRQQQLPEESPTTQMKGLTYDFRTWSNFFQSCGITETVAKECETIFIEKQVDFSKLKDFDLVKLRSLGIKLGYSLKILKAIQKMKE